MALNATPSSMPPDYAAMQFDYIAGAPFPVGADTPGNQNGTTVDAIIPFTVDATTSVRLYVDASFVVVRACDTVEFYVHFFVHCFHSPLMCALQACYDGSITEAEASIGNGGAGAPSLDTPRTSHYHSPSPQGSCRPWACTCATA